MKIKLSDIDFETSCKVALKKIEQNKVLTKSLREEGQITPIVVYMSDDNKYIIIDGMSRYISAKILGWYELKAIIGTIPSTIMDLTC